MDYKDLNVQLESAADSWKVTALTGREALGELFEFSLTIHPARHPLHPPADPRQLLMRRVRLRFELDGHDERMIDGIVARVSERRSNERRPRAKGEAPFQWVVEMVPAAWLLTRSQRSFGYVAQGLDQILREVLGRVHFTPHEYRLSLSPEIVEATRGNAPENTSSQQTNPNGFVLQYEETDWSFLCRLAEQLGVALCFVHDPAWAKSQRPGEGEVLVLTDQAQGLPSTRLSLVTDVDIEKLERHLAVVPKTYCLRGYDPTRSAGDDGNARFLSHSTTVGTSGFGEVIECEGLATDVALLAPIRAAARARGHERRTGATNTPALAAGCLLDIDDVGISDPPRQRVLWVEHELKSGSYSNRFESVAASLPYRPERRTLRPRVDGVLLGVVEGKVTAGTGTGSDKVDALGRYSVTLACTQQRTNAIAKVQAYAGTGRGEHSPLLPGTEVLVAFEAGNPDRPFIVGAVPTEVHTSPATLTNADRNVFHSQHGTLVQYK